MKRATFAITLILGSMGSVAVAVKAQDKALTSVNKAKSSNESDLKDSVKGDPSEISKLVQTMMASGRDGKYVNGMAQAIGLDRPMSAKNTMVLVGREARRCQIVYEADATNGDRPFCVYLLRTKKTSSDVEERYYRVSLDGRLEKVITLKNKLDDQGKALREGRSRVEEDMTSPGVKKAFNAEMTFWLKDWLKKQQKLDAKKATASAAKSGTVATTGATTVQAAP